MRIVFAGTPEFSIPALEALHAARHRILAVLTQPDRPAGRGRQLTPSPVARRATELGLEVQRFPRLDAGAQAYLRTLEAEAMVVVAYGLLLPQTVLDIPLLGCLNIHGSLLPRWRGAAPIARAVEAGDPETGITIMRMEAGLDTGPMLLTARLPITADDTAASLHDALAPMGARLVVEALARLAGGTLAETPQPANGATYARKLSKEEARVDWSVPVAQLARRIRAFNPAPVAWTELAGERIRLWDATALEGAAAEAPGTLLAATGALEVAGIDGRLRIRRLQRPGGRVLDAATALRDWNVLGQHFA